MRERDDVRRNIGLVFQDTTLDGYLTAAQNLRLHAELYGVPRELVQPRMRQVLDMVGLFERRDNLVSTFSGGMQRRLEIAAVDSSCLYMGSWPLRWQYGWPRKLQRQPLRGA